MVDSDRDGRIDFREFLINLSTVIKGDHERKLRLAFALYDMDKTGYITREQMLEIHSVSVLDLVKKKVRLKEGSISCFRPTIK